MKKKKLIKKRICFPFIGDSLGGSHKSAAILISKLDQKIFEPIVILHQKGLLENFLKKKRIQYKILHLNRIVGSKKGFFHFISSVIISTFILSYFLLRNNIHIVHTNDTGTHLTWAIPSFLTRKRLIWHCRNLYPKWKLFYFFTFFPDKLLCISNYVKKSIPGIYKYKSHVILNPIEVSNIKKNLKKKLGYKKNDFIIGFVANLWKRKKPLAFIELAEKIINKTNKKIFFIVAGSDREISKTMLKKEIENKKLSKKIKLLDFIDPVEPLLSTLDLLFVPAINEPFGRVLIESMSVKTPVIANKSGGHIEIIKNNFNGCLCNIDDMKTTLNLVLEIIKKKDKLKSFTEHAYTFVKERFNYNSHVKNVSYFYN